MKLETKNIVYTIQLTDYEMETLISIITFVKNLEEEGLEEEEEKILKELQQIAEE